MLQVISLATPARWGKDCYAGDTAQDLEREALGLASAVPQSACVILGKSPKRSGPQFSLLYKEE